LERSIDRAGRGRGRKFKPLVLGEIQAAGDRWSRSEPDARRWTRRSPGGQAPTDGSPVSFEGDLRITDYSAGEIQITDDAAHLRSTLRRDGYRRTEQLDRQNSKVVRSTERFPDGREIERIALDEEALKPLGLAGRNYRSAERVTLKRSAGRIRTVELVEAETPAGRMVVRYRNGDSWWTRTAELGRRQNHWTRPEGGEYWGDVSLVGAEAMRFRDETNTQIRTFYGDGSEMLHLFTWRPRLSPGLSFLTQPFELVEEPVYTIRRTAAGLVTIIDHQDGQVYRSDSLDARSGVTVEGRDVSFTDRHQTKVTIARDGVRTFVYPNGGRTMTDEGGVVESRGPDQQRLDAYRHIFPGGSAVLDQFADREFLWKMSVTRAGTQDWELQNGADGKHMKLQADHIRMNDQNGLVINNGNIRTTKTRDGTTIEQTRSFDFATRTNITEIVVSLTETGQEAYRLVTHEADGVQLKEELRGGKTRSARRADGFWHQVNDKDEAIPGTAWAGDVRIDENGVLIRRAYATEPDPGSPNGVWIRVGQQRPPCSGSGRHALLPHLRRAGAALSRRQCHPSR
jgi:hypothetical protein